MEACSGDITVNPHGIEVTTTTTRLGMPMPNQCSLRRIILRVQNGRWTTSLTNSDQSLSADPIEVQAFSRIVHFSKETKMMMPRPAKVLFFNELEPVLCKKDKNKDYFYHLKKRKKVKCPMSSWSHPLDVREYWFYTSGNTLGELVVVFAGLKMGRVSPELAEIMGVREALSWLKDHAHSHAIVETDSLVCAEAVRSAEVFASAFGLVVEDCKTLLHSMSNVSLVFVKRSANCATHYVVRHSVSLAERMFSINSVPLDLMSILTSDCSNF
uniref:RNase H type-1 domain-containing protein n=1 Tax=Cannabis sativa TaxID=3483 RepID=A0A803QRJ3_CANSA